MKISEIPSATETVSQTDKNYQLERRIRLLVINQ